MQKNEKKQECRCTYSLCKYTLMTCALMVVGCTQRSPTQIVVKKTQDGALHIEQNSDISMFNLMEIAEDVLTEMYFTIEKATHQERYMQTDTQSGIIRTRPLPGAQFFEFWRSDNVGAENAIEANLHTIRRTATLYLRRQEMELSIDCEVYVQRLSLPEQHLSSSSRIYGMFSQSSRSLQRLKLNPEQAERMAWIDLAPDRQLEAKILKRIESQIIKQTKHMLQTTESET